VGFDDDEGSVEGSSIEVSEAGRGEFTGVSRVVVVVFVIVKLSNDGTWSDEEEVFRTPPNILTSSSVTHAQNRIESVGFTAKGREGRALLHLAQRSILECCPPARKVHLACTSQL